MDNWLVHSVTRYNNTNTSGLQLRKKNDQVSMNGFNKTFAEEMQLTDSKNQKLFKQLLRKYVQFQYLWK